MIRYVLTIQCTNRPGIVAAVATLLAARGGDITEAQQFDDPETGRFFMRTAFSMDGPSSALESDLGERAAALGLDWTLRPEERRQRVLLLVSLFDHCLADLLYRYRIGELNIEPVGIVSNHPQEALRSSPYPGIPFHHLPVTNGTKAEQEAAIKALVEETGAELVVLARYMQILSDDMSTYLSGRCINIHHSFLPGFKGARPYGQAHARGVKMIGATAHYVTADLDEGPIIAQAVEDVTHADSADDLVRKGRDIERRVLARAVGHHVQGRVLLNGGKTVVFAK